MGCETIRTFFPKSEKHDFLRFLELLHAFFRSLVVTVDWQSSARYCETDHSIVVNQNGQLKFNAGPRIWNSLLPSLRQPDIEFRQFKRLLKTFLYSETAAH